MGITIRPRYGMAIAVGPASRMEPHFFFTEGTDEGRMDDLGCLDRHRRGGGRGAPHRKKGLPAMVRRGFFFFFGWGGRSPGGFVVGGCSPPRHCASSAHVLSR